MAIESNLPKRLTKQASKISQEVLQPNEAKDTVIPASKPKTSKKEAEVKSSSTPPKVPYLTLGQFNSVPKYMKGRWNYDQINTCIDEFNESMEARYTFLGKGFQPKASIAVKKRFKVRLKISVDN